MVKIKFTNKIYLKNYFKLKFLHQQKEYKITLEFKPKLKYYQIKKKILKFIFQHIKINLKKLKLIINKI